MTIDKPCSAADAALVVRFETSLPSVMGSVFRLASPKHMAIRRLIAIPVTAALRLSLAGKPRAWQIAGCPDRAHNREMPPKPYRRRGREGSCPARKVVTAG